MNKKLLGLAIAAALGGSLNAQAFITFDTNGTGAAGVIQTDVFDWSPGNTLFKNLVDTPLGTKAFDLYGHGTLTAFLLGGLPTSLAPVGQEFTYTFQVPMLASFTGGTSWDLNSLGGGQFEIFYSSANSNTNSGANFADGKLILQGLFNPFLIVPGQSGSIKTIVSPGVKPPLDSFGADGKPLVDSDIINGNLSFQIDAFYADDDFFITDVTSSLLGFDVDLSSQLAAPFTQVNPSAIVGGVAGEITTTNGAAWGAAGPTAGHNQTPNFGGDGINNASCTAFPCDLQTQTDASSTFRAQAIPEPATLALIGASLLGFGMSRRRGRKV